MKSPEKEKWIAAMEDELKVIQERKVWDLVPRPANTKILGQRWVFTKKYNEKGETIRHKARLVAQGYSQQKGESYEEVFSPVVNFAVIRLFFALLVSLHGWTHCQLDIKNAYLYADLDKVIYMFQPTGFEDDQRPEYVCKLTKALYGLHQSGRQWYFEIYSVLEELEFKEFKWCNCCFIFKNSAILLLYVDDIIVFAKSEEIINNVIAKLQKKFDLKILGKTKKLLGVNFNEKNNTLTIDQEEYIDKVCKRFKKFKYSVSTLPISKGFILSKNDSPRNQIERDEMSALPYRSLIGCLSFIAGRTRPDLAYAVNILSQFQEDPGKLHWSCLLRLLGYLETTKSLKLNLSNITSSDIRCYSDADFANNRDDRVSMSGLLLFVGNAPIVWRTSKQKCVTLSSMEAEYVAMSEAAKETIWITNIIKECRTLNLCKMSFESVLLCDNQSAIEFSKSPIENARTKHIDVRLHFIRGLIYKRKFRIKYVSSKQNHADIFTKAPTKVQLNKFISLLFLK
jgi:hypothetical protein